MEGSLKLLNNENCMYYANSAIGLAGGYSAYKYLPALIKNPYLNYCLNNCKQIPASEHSQYWSSAIDAFLKSPSFNTRVQILDVNQNNWNAIADNLIQRKQAAYSRLKKTSPVKAFLMKVLAPNDEKIKRKIKSIALGQNASFLPSTSQIFVNSEKMGITTFHEIGHSINQNGKGFKKMLAKSRKITHIALPAILGIGLLTPKREENDKYQNQIGKAATFIKDHCGLLAGMSLMPVVLEEGTASINAAKLAKTVLDKSSCKKVNKVNLVAFGSYALVTLLTAACTALAIYIKDRVSGNAPVRDNN